MWKCYQCGATGNPSGFAATTRELEAHFATSTHPVKNSRSRFWVYAIVAFSIGAYKGVRI